MKTQTLASAFAAALDRSNAELTAQCPTLDDSTLLRALRNSATHLDQIVWRRTGQAFAAEAINIAS